MRWLCTAGPVFSSLTPAETDQGQQPALCAAPDRPVAQTAHFQMGTLSHRQPRCSPRVCRLTDHRCQVLPPCSPAFWKPPSRVEERVGLPGTPSLLSPLISSAVTSPGLRLHGSGNICECSGVYTREVLCGSPAFPSIQSSPREWPRKGWVRAPVWPCPGGSLVSQGGSSHPTPVDPAHPTSYCPPAPDGFGNHSKHQAFFWVLFFFLSSPLMQTHLDYLSKDFPFPFLERHQGPACPFHHKGGWEERGVSRVSPGRSE